MKKGDCFERSGNAILNPARMLRGLCQLDGWQLAHGIVTGTGGAVRGRRYAHAWVENDFLVFNADSGDVVPRPLFYFAGKVEDVFRYSPEEARRLMLKHEHYGPWEDLLYADDLAG